jgi:5-methylcytosine-specific restriction enzyme A
MAKRIRTLGPVARPLYQGLTKPVKEKAEIYRTAEYKAWRLAVMTRADWQCEWREGGTRCAVRSPPDKLYADHRTEVIDGGHPHDVNNGQALCSRHHQIKGARARAARAGKVWTKNNAGDD